MPVVVPFVVSHLYRPMLLDRYTIAASPTYFVLVTQGVAGLKDLANRERNYAQALLVVLVTTLSAVSIAGYLDAMTKQPWRNIAGHVDEHRRPGDLVLLYGSTLPFDHYSERADLNTEAFGVTTNARMRKTVSATVAGRDRVWLVVFWETGLARRVLPEQLTRPYGETTHNEVYAVTDAYNNEVATFPYHGDGIDLLHFEGPERVRES